MESRDRLDWFGRLILSELVCLFCVLPLFAEGRATEHAVFGLEPGACFVLFDGDSIAAPSITVSPAGTIAGELPRSGGISWVPLSLEVTPSAAFVGPFRIHLPEGSRASKLQVLGASGRTIRTLSLPTGRRQEAAWDGQGSSGEWLPPGSYLVVAATGSGRMAGWVTLAW